MKKHNKILEVCYMDIRESNNWVQTYLWLLKIIRTYKIPGSVKGSFVYRTVSSQDRKASPALGLCRDREANHSS